MESFCGFSPEIPDRLVQSASKSRDIVLCLLQALPEARSRSLNRVQVSSMVTGSLQTARSVMARGRCGARYGSTWLAIIHFAVDSFALHGADGRSQYYVVCNLAHFPEILGWRTGTRHSPEG